MTLGTHRFQRAVSAKDLLIGTRPPGDALPRIQSRLIPINKSLAETARWKRCVPSYCVGAHCRAAFVTRDWPPASLPSASLSMIRTRF